MVHEENKSGILTNLILVFLMSTTVCQALYTSLFMTYRFDFGIFFYAIPFVLLLYLAFKNKITLIVSGVLLVLAAISILFFVGIQELDSYATWFVDAMNGYIDTSLIYYKALTVVLMTLMITLIIFIFTIKIHNFYLVSIVTFSTFFAQAYLQIFVSKPAFVLFLFSFLLYYFFHILIERTREKSYNPGNRLKYLVLVVPFCIIIFLLSFTFPIREKRLSWPWLDHRLDNIILSLSDKNTSDFDFFSLKATGFGNSNRLGGNIKPDKTHVMDVRSQYRNVYLKASSKAYYDGHGWFGDDPDLKPIVGDDSKGSYSSMIGEDSDELRSLSQINKTNINDEMFMSTKIEIKFVDLKTKSLFIPSKTNQLILRKPLGLFMDVEGMISAAAAQSRNFDYSIIYNNLFLNSEAFKNNIRKSYRGYFSKTVAEYLDRSYLENITNQSSANASNRATQTQSPGNDILLNRLSERTTAIYSKYTSLPENIPLRVNQLAEQITKNKTNSYDKAKAIENYLSSNYPYTLKPGTPPKKKDFVDYFLFEGKKGYCTYYASAMTVMLRSIGIPARYVEGYILPPDNSYGLFQVTNQQAHAWVEVYFDGFGWIPFEPTSPFSDNIYRDNEIKTFSNSEMNTAGYNDYMEMLKRYQNNGQADIDYTPDTSEAEPEKTNIPFIAIISAASILSLIILFLIILAIVNNMRFYYILRRIRKGDPKNAVLTGYCYILKVLWLQEVVINAGETPSQFGARVEKLLDFKGYTFKKTDFKHITDYYLKARYSTETLPEKANEEILYFIDTVLNMTREKLSKIKYYVFKYFLGKL
jgi:hypothetical protein